MAYSGVGLGPGKTTLLDAMDLTQMASWMVLTEGLAKKQYLLARAALAEALLLIPDGQESFPWSAFRDMVFGKLQFDLFPQRYAKRTLCLWSDTLL